MIFDIFLVKSRERGSDNGGLAETALVHSSVLRLGKRPTATVLRRDFNRGGSIGGGGGLHTRISPALNVRHAGDMKQGGLS